MIDPSKPWYPQDYTLEEVLLEVKRMPLSTDEEHTERLVEVTRDYNLRKGGVAGVFNNLRNRILEAVGEPDPEGGHVVLDYKELDKMVTHEIASTICTLEGSSIPSTRFVIQEYAVPVWNRDAPPEYNCKPILHEEVRPVSDGRIIKQYWDLVNS